MGTQCWGHDTGVTEDFTGDWLDGFGTGLVTDSGDSELLCLDSGEYWVLPSVNTGAIPIEITYDQYASGSGVYGLIQYRMGVSQEACEGQVVETPFIVTDTEVIITEDTEVIGPDEMGWTEYTGHFISLGWVQVRISKDFIDLDTQVIETEDTEVIDTEDTSA